MKKKALIILLAMVASVCVAGIDVTGRATFTGTGAGPEIVIPDRKGNAIVNVSMLAMVETNATVVVRRPKTESKVYAAASASTNVWVLTPGGSNDFSGLTPTTSDYLLIEQDGSSGFQLRQISVIRTNNSDRTLYTLDASVTASAGDKIFLCDDGDKINLMLTATNASVYPSTVEYSAVFTGYKGKPVVIDVPASAGDGVMFSGVVNYEK